MSMPMKETRITAADMTPVQQFLTLICAKCGVKQAYDVGSICIQDDETGDERFQFTNYFRCVNCASPGPFGVADFWKIIGEAMAAKFKKSKKVFSGRIQLFDGTAHQTVAMSEDYLKELIAKDPGNAFLHVRMGNLMRAAKHETSAVEWYERAVGLDPHDLEALGSLEELSIDREDFRTALRCAWAILNAIGRGRRASTDELTHAILAATLHLMNENADDFSAVWDEQPADLRNSGDGQLLQEFMDMGDGLDERVESFVATALGEGASDDLSQNQGMETIWTDPKLRPVEMERSLDVVVVNSSLNWEDLRLVLPAREKGRLTIPARNNIILTDGERVGQWNVLSLRTLFRGDRQPPPETEMEQYPVDYVDLIYCVEYHVSLVAGADRDPTDEEFIELYSTMRRRPDGKSLGLMHDVVWQSACLALGMVKYSEAEYGAVFGQLTRSARHFRKGPSSRNYIEYLLSTFDR